MPETRTNKVPDTNGATAVDPVSHSTSVADRYRPKASTTAVHDAVLSSLASVVSSATHTAWEFLSLVEVYDRDATTAIRLGHLVDASECLEIAMTHLGQLKAL